MVAVLVLVHHDTYMWITIEKIILDGMCILTHSSIQHLHIHIFLGLLSVSNPRLTVIETLSKLTHDQDQQVSQNAVLAMGFLGAGTNNSRISNILRQLATYYAKEPNHLFLVRIAQGLLHMGKGLLTISPFHSDGVLMSKVAVAGLLTVLHASLDLKNS